MRAKPLTLLITEKLWKETQKEAVRRILNLLANAEVLLSVGDSRVCAGLYTYAVEEYGKLLFLMEEAPDASGNVIITYKEEFRNHNAKIPKALNALPLECRTLKEPDFDPAFFDPACFDTEEVIADFDARMAMFYTDFNDSGDDLLFAPPVEKDKLMAAIAKLRQIVNGVTI